MSDEAPLNFNEEFGYHSVYIYIYMCNFTQFIIQVGFHADFESEQFFSIQEIERSDCLHRLHLSSPSRTQDISRQDIVNMSESPVFIRWMCKHEEQHVHQALKDSGHSHRFIRRTATKCFPPLAPPLPPHHVSEPRSEPMALFPTYGDYQNPARVLQQLNIYVRVRHNHTLRQILMKPKDPVPEMSQNGVVYRIPCQDCPRKYKRRKYVQYKRSLQQRLKKHE